MGNPHENDIEPEHENTDGRRASLVIGLTHLPRETEWVEFKENNLKPEEVGEYISALSNSAALSSQSRGYIVWGIRDHDHEIVGTNVDPTRKIGNEDLQNWLLRLLTPQIHFEFSTVMIHGQRIVLLEIDSATHMPVRFKDNEWIRVSSYKKKLKEHPDHARRLWKTLDSTPFEKSAAMLDVDGGEVIDLIDYPAYFDLFKRRLPAHRAGILSDLASDSIIEKTPHGSWNITNLGAILFAKDLKKFPSLHRKALRIIHYKGNSRIQTIREQIGVKGYAAGFAGAINFLNTLIPTNEVIGAALRDDTPMFPTLAIRELLANALIHQDFSQRGSGPMVELFDQRIEITSPGTPLIDPARFIDAPPRSRNEDIAAMMRRAGICEERGSGWDKIAFEIEFHQLPAPLVEVPESSTRVVLFGPKKLRDMDKNERIRAVYLHACLKHVMQENMTNSSLRERFGIKQESSALASRLIGEAVDAGLIAPFDPNAGKKYMRYVPAWAADEDGSPI